MSNERQPVLRARLEIAINVFDENDGGIDNDAKIDGTDRQQVGILTAHDQNHNAEEQRERNIGAHDDGAAQVAEE